MDQLKAYLKRATSEWEVVALIVAGIAFLITVATWILGSGSDPQAGVGIRRLPVPETMIKSQTAYAMLGEQQSLPELSQHPFRPESDFETLVTGKPPKKEAPKEVAEKPPPDKKPPPEKVVEAQAPPAGPVAKKEEPPEPGKVEAAPNYHVLTYEGYRTTETGERLALFHNHTTGQTTAIRAGHKLQGYMVAGFSGTELTFVAPSGREHVVAAKQRIKVPARP